MPRAHQDDQEDFIFDRTPSDEAGPSRPTRSNDASPDTPAPGPASTPLSALFPPLHLPPMDEASTPPAPYTDRACFSFCAQSSARRAAELEPLCRMVCLAVNPPDIPGARGWESDKRRAERVQRGRVRRWIEEREVLLFRGAQVDLDRVQRGEGKGEDGDEDRRRRRQRKVESEGGFVVDRRKISEESTLTTVPLSTLTLAPLAHIQHSLSLLLSPPLRLLSLYASSFTDGTQSRVLGLAWDRAVSGEVGRFSAGLGRRVWGVWFGRKEGEEEERRRREGDEEDGKR